MRERGRGPEVAFALRDPKRRAPARTAFRNEGPPPPDRGFRPDPNRGLKSERSCSSLILDSNTSLGAAPCCVVQRLELFASGAEFTFEERYSTPNHHS